MSNAESGVLSKYQTQAIEEEKVVTSAANRSIGSTTITEKAPTRAFSWLKAPTSVFTFKTLC